MSPDTLTTEQIERLAEFATKQPILGTVELEFLRYFAENQSLSTYEIYALRKGSRPMIYKNVHSRVTRLHELGLIERIRKESLHSAKYYKLNTLGIFYLMYNKRTTKSMLINHGDDILLKELLDPILDRHSVQKYSHLVLLTIMDYLSNCCEEIRRGFERMKDSEYWSIKLIFFWQEVPGEYTSKLIKFLKERFGLNLEDKYTQIKKVNNGNAIVISDGMNVIHINLDLEKKKSRIIINGKQEFELTVIAGKNRPTYVGEDVSTDLRFLLENSVTICSRQWFFQLVRLADHIPSQDVNYLRQDDKIRHLSMGTLFRFIKDHDTLLGNVFYPISEQISNLYRRIISDGFLDSKEAELEIKMNIL